MYYTVTAYEQVGTPRNTVMSRHKTREAAERKAKGLLMIKIVDERDIISPVSRSIRRGDRIVIG